MAWEFALLDFFQTLHGEVTDFFFSTVTHLGDGGLFWIALSLIFMCTKKYRKAGFTMALAMLLGVCIGNGILKPLFARVRPYDIVPGIDTIVKRPTDFSFPSGHTLASVEASLSLFFYYKKEGIIALVIAALVAFSRMYLYIHYPTDILGGIVLGVLCSFAARYIVGRLYARREAKLRQ